MSTRRHQRALRAIGGFSGGSRLARPPQVLQEPDVRPGAPCVPPPETSWSAHLERDNSNGTAFEDGVPFDFGIWESDANTTSVLFVLTPDELVDVDIELFTEVNRIVWPNGSDIGDLRLSTWLLQGANSDTDLSITMTGLEFNPWTIAYGQLPYLGATVVMTDEFTSGSVSLTNPDGGPVIGCAVRMGSTTDTTITLPGTGSSGHRNFVNTLDSFSADMAHFSSVSPGPITVAGTSAVGPAVLVGFQC